MKKKRHFVMTVEDSTPQVRIFNSLEKMKRFVKSFVKKYPYDPAGDSSYWLEFQITDISGDIVLSEPSMEVK